MKHICLIAALLMGSSAWANEANASKVAFFKAALEQTPFEINGIEFTRVTVENLQSEADQRYYVIARASGKVNLKCDGSVIFHEGEVVEVAPKSYKEICMPID